MIISTGYELGGNFVHCASDKETLIQSLRGLGSLCPAALNRLVEEYSYPLQKRHRHHVAQTLGGVYPRRPDLIHEVVEFLPGYFVGTNENADTKLELLMRLCYFANVEYERDFRAACLEGDGERRKQLEREFETSRRLGWDKLGL